MRFLLVVFLIFIVSCSSLNSKKELDGYLIFAQTQHRDKKLGLDRSRILTYFIPVDKLKSTITESINSERYERYLPILLTTLEEDLSSTNIGLKNCGYKQELRALSNFDVNAFLQKDKYSMVEALDENLEYLYKVVYVSGEWKPLNLNDGCLSENVDWGRYFMDYIEKPYKIQEIFLLTEVDTIDFDRIPQLR